MTKHIAIPLDKLEGLRDLLALAVAAIDALDEGGWNTPEHRRLAKEKVAWATSAIERAEAQPDPGDRFGGFLAAQLSDFVGQMKDATRSAAEEVIGEVETAYLPHLENDYWMNADTIARRAVLAFLGGANQPEPREDDITVDLSSYDAKEVRAAIFRDHREAIIEATIKDRDEKIASLKRQLEFAKVVHR